MSKLKNICPKDASNTFTESLVAVGFESRSFFAAMRRHGIPKPLSSPCLATYESNSAAPLREYSLELEKVKSMKTSYVTERKEKKNHKEIKMVVI